MTPDRTPPSRTLRGDAGEIILGWLTRVAVLLSVLGVLAFDGVALGAAQFRAEDRAQAAMRAAGVSFEVSKDLQAAYEAALSEAPEDTIDPTTFSVAPDGTVTLTLTHSTSTLLVEKIGPLQQYATVSRTVTGRPLT